MIDTLEITKKSMNEMWGEYSTKTQEGLNKLYTKGALTTHHHLNETRKSV